MKCIVKAFVLFMLIMSFKTSEAQVTTDRRPSLFSTFSNTTNFPKSELEKIFLTTEGHFIKLSLAENVSFTGTVTSSLQKYDNLKSVIIKLSNLDNTVLSMSQLINDDKSISYVGRIINHKYGDAFDLKTDANGNYFINKIKTATLVEDHD